jgi:uncharacterized protein YndB with AHSA1/START domain
MTEGTMTMSEFRALVEREIEIEAPPGVVFDAILAEMAELPDMEGKPLKLKIEPRPGGRWFRDLGNDTGHLWGHVQVIKPPVLLEICGPMMMSYPVLNHVTYRVTERGDRCVLSIKHRAFGELDPRFAGGKEGWGKFLQGVKAIATSRK